MMKNIINKSLMHQSWLLLVITVSNKGQSTYQVYMIY